MGSTHGYSDQELCDAVFLAVARSSEPISRLQIARAIGRSKSPRVIDMIEYLTSSGYLIKEQRPVDFSHIPVFVYRINPDMVVSHAEACGSLPA